MQVLSEVLKTRVSEGVVEMAPTTHVNQPLLPAVGLLHVAAGPEGLEELDDLEVAHGDVLSVLVLAQNVGSVHIIDGGEDAV